MIGDGFGPFHVKCITSPVLIPYTIYIKWENVIVFVTFNMESGPGYLSTG